MDNLVGELGVISLDHTAVAVRSITAALPLYRDMLGGTPSAFERLPGRGFQWLTLEYPDSSDVELLEPLGEDGFLHKFLEGRGEGAHHMTYMVADLRRSVERARAAGLRVVDEDYANPHWQEAFISPRSAFGIIIQLAQSDLNRLEREHHWSLADMPLRP